MSSTVMAIRTKALAHVTYLNTNNDSLGCDRTIFPVVDNLSYRLQFWQ